jgi:AcrR family transcriptional regulator
VAYVAGSIEVVRTARLQGDQGVVTPRAFSEAGRAAVRERLLSAAAAHFARYGYRRANVSEIAAEAGIGKGTLYLFFASKSELLIAAVQALESALRARLLEEMARPYPSARERIRRFLQLHVELLSSEPLLAVMVNPEEAAALMRDLPMEKLATLQSDDEAFYSELAREWQRTGEFSDVRPSLFAALPRALFAVVLQREVVGPEVDEVIALLIDGLSGRLAPGSPPA